MITEFKYINDVLDEDVKKIISGNNNMAISWWLIASFCYYVLHETIISDEYFDELTKFIQANYNQLNHVNKDLIDEGMLQAGTAFNLKRDDYPLRVQVCADIISRDLITKSKSK